MTFRDTKVWLLAALCEFFSLTEKEPSITWVPKHVNLPREVSPTHPGLVDLDVTPVTTLVYDWFDDPQWRELIMVKGSQGGASQAAQNLSVYIAEHQLGDIMWTLESDKKVVELNNERLKPMITKSCESLRRFIYEDEDKLKNRVLLLKGLKINMAGARTASAVASRTVPFHFGDEVDEWPIELGGNESNALDLLRERAKLIPWAKLFFFSKPRNDITPEQSDDHKLRNRKKKDDGIIWAEYLTGTRHKCHIECPHCAHPHELVWENVRFQHCRTEDGKAWDYVRMERETFFQCPSCNQGFTEEQKVHQLLHHRKWVQTNFDGDEDNEGNRINLPIPKKMSAHISDLYANTREFPELTVGKLAVKWCSATTTSARRAFRRGTLGLPVVKQKFEKLDIAPLLSLAGTYARGSVPTRPAWTDMMIDVQGHGKLYKWLKLGYGKVTNHEVDDTVWIIDHGETESEEELEAIFAKPIPVLDEAGEWIIRDGERIWTGKHITSQTGWIDEGDGFTSNQVLNLCIRPKLYPRFGTVKGRGGKQTEHMIDRVILQENRTHKTKRVDRYLIDADYFLDELYEERIAKRDLIDQALHKKLPPPAGRLWFFANAAKGFLSEFCTEKKDYHLRLGKLVFGWLPKPVGGKNDFSDLVKYGLAKWYRTKPKILEALHRQKRQTERMEAAASEQKQGTD